MSAHMTGSVNGWPLARRRLEPFRSYLGGLVVSLALWGAAFVSVAWATSPTSVGSAAVALNRSGFRAGQTLTYRGTLFSGTAPAQVDLYFGALLPDGVTFFSLVQESPGVISSAIGPSPIPFQTNVPFTNHVVNYTYTFAGTESFGTYFAYAAAAVAESDPLQAANRLSLAVQSYQFSSTTTTTGTIYYVATTGSDANPGTETQPFRTIQKAASVVNPGDTVIVKDGTYVDTQIDSYSSVVRVHRGGDAARWVTFKSENPLGAKIDGQNNTIEVGWWVDAPYVRIEDFDISNLSKAGFEGWSSDHVQIIGNNIHHTGRICTNTSVGLDAAYLYQSSDWVFDSNIFHDLGRLDSSEGCGLTANLQLDHALYLAGVDSITITNNIFYNIFRGWSVHLYNGDSGGGASNVKILNNTFAFPGSHSAGGHIILASPSVTDSLITNNIFYQPQGSIAIAYYSVSLSNVQVQNNITYQGTITASPPAGISFSGNLDNTNPQLVSPSTNNFRLLSTSPAIDAGVSPAPTVTMDFDGLARPQGSAIDLGAFEFTGP